MDWRFPLLISVQTHPYNLATKVDVQEKEGEMDSLWLALHWGSPIGLGIFLICLGGMIYLISKADEISKRTKAFVKEKGLEKKKE